MAKQWHFEHDEHSQWRWTLVDGGKETARSTRTFADQLGCMMDAMRFVLRRTRAKAKVDAAGSGHQPH